MSLPVVAALPITFILFLINVWWDQHWKLRTLPTPVGFVVHVARLARSHPILPRRLVLLSSGAMKRPRSKTTKAINGVLGSTNAVELSKSKRHGVTQIS